MTPAPASGLLLGLAAYTLWGLLPLYLRLLGHVPPVAILAHRVLWSLVLLAAVVALLRRTQALRATARGRTLKLLCASALLIGVNWLVYLVAIQTGHVLEASLGYFINPLVNVALGVTVLGERLRRMQGVAVALAAAGVLVMALSGGGAIWISLALALSFGLYALVRKVAAIDALGGLTVETLLLGPAALAFLAAAGPEFDVSADPFTAGLLVLAGPVTAAPLLLFAAAARQLPLTTLGLLQYLAPTLQFLEAILVFGEPLRPVHLVTFGLIWTGCAVFAADAVRARRETGVTVPE